MAKRYLNKIHGLALCLAGFMATGLAHAEVPPTGVAAVPVMTRLMKVLGDQEKALQHAIGKGDRAAIEALLTEGFEEQAGAARVSSIPREEWVSAVLAQPKPLADYRLEVVSARELGDFTALSFRFHETASQKKSWGRFVVDIWKNEGVDHWRLVARYSAPVKDAGSPNLPDGKK